MTRTTIGRALGGAISIGRTAFGAGFIARPRLGAAYWIGPRVARRPQTGVLARGFGGRDLALGLGATAALARGNVGSARGWLLAQSLADGVDLGATLVARDELPKPSVVAASALAGGSAVLGLVAAALLTEKPGTNEEWVREGGAAVPASAARAQPATSAGTP